MVEQEPDIALSDPGGENAPDEEHHAGLPVVYTPTGLIPYVPPASSRVRQTICELVVFVSLLLLLILFGVLVLLIEQPWQPNVATILISPRTQVISQTITLPAVNGSPGAGQLTARFLVATAPAQTASAPATGSGTQPARAAVGQITFYNLAPYPQTIPSETRLSAADGVQVKTLVQAVVPAGNAPVQGVLTVQAQALQTGPGGNIPAGAVSQECCADNLIEGVYAKNLAPFTGGQDAQTFLVVQQSDIDAVVPALIKQGEQDSRAALLALMKQGEQPVGDSPCTPDIHTSSPAGSRAAQTRITVSVTCSEEVYDAAMLEQLARARYSASAQALLGQAYRQVGSLHLSTPHIIAQDARHRVLTLALTAQGTWVFQVARAHLTQLLPQIAGKPWSEVRPLLLAVPGVAKVTISGYSGFTLPAKPGDIIFSIQQP